MVSATDLEHEKLIEVEVVFGRDKNLCRLVHGVASLPLGTLVELEAVFEV